MAEYIDLIHKEKQEALQDYNEETFRSRLDQKIGKDTQPSRSYSLWFQKPAVAGASVLLLIFLCWLSTQFFLPSSLGLEETLIKNTFIHLFSQNRTILNRIPPPVDEEYEISAIDEFEWSIKRVFFVIQRENAPDEDIAQSLSRVLKNTTSLFKPGINKSGELNI
jgi:hypothetical protein